MTPQGYFNGVKVFVTEHCVTSVPRRKHKKRRVQKKWLKRYGTTNIPYRGLIVADICNERVLYCHPIHNDDMCGADIQILEKYALDLINHLQKADEKNKDDIRFLQLAIDQKRRKIIRLEEDNQELKAEVESLEAENKDLIKDNQSLKFAKQSLENERLKVEIDFYKHSPMITIFEQWKKEIEAEAYKECIEKVRNLAVGMHPCSDEMRIFDSDLDNLLKELVGEEK